MTSESECVCVCLFGSQTCALVRWLRGLLLGSAKALPLNFAASPRGGKQGLEFGGLGMLKTPCYWTERECKVVSTSVFIWVHMSVMWCAHFLLHTSDPWSLILVARSPEPVCLLACNSFVCKASVAPEWIKHITNKYALIFVGLPPAPLRNPCSFRGTKCLFLCQPEGFVFY